MSAFILPTEILIKLNNDCYAVTIEYRWTLVEGGFPESYPWLINRPVDSRTF